MSASLHNSSLFPGRPALSEGYNHRNYRTKIWSEVAPAPLPRRGLVFSYSVPLPGGNFGIEHQMAPLICQAQSAPLPHQRLSLLSSTGSSHSSASASVGPSVRGSFSEPLRPRPTPVLSGAVLTHNTAPARAPLVLTVEQKKQMTRTLAYCIYEERLRSSVGGDAAGDWYMAESRLNEVLLGRPIGEVSLPQSFRTLAFINVRRCLAGLLNEAAGHR